MRALRLSSARAPGALLFFALVASLGVELAGCGARSTLAIDQPAAGLEGSSASSSSSSSGGAVPLDCAALRTTSVVALDVAGGRAKDVELAFASSSGRVVSLFHGWSKDAAPSGLRSSTIEPWEAWPPGPGSTFTVDPEGGSTFAVANASYGAVGLLLHHKEPEPEPAEGLYFVTSTSATTPGGLLALQMASADEDPRAAFLVRGYDTPPVAFNEGYLAMLGAWDALDKETGIHALRYAISVTGVDILGGIVTRPDGDDLACATEPIVSAGVRVGSSWLVAASSGSPLVSCLVGVAKKPTSLVVDRLVWSTPDTVDWTLERADDEPGERVIESLAMTPAAADGAWILVGRRGEDAQRLVRVGHDGKLRPEISLKSPGKQGVLKSSLASLANAVLIAEAGVDAPSRLGLELHDAHGAARLHAELDAQGAVASLSTLEAPDERSVLLAWTLQGEDGRLRVARVTCEGAP